MRIFFPEKKLQAEKLVRQLQVKEMLMGKEVLASS